MLKNLLLLAALLLPAERALAQDASQSGLTINQPWSMALPPNAPTVAAYFVIDNTRGSADRLTRVDSPVAGMAQLHEHISSNGLMKMHQVDSVNVPANARVTFAPMAYHVMLLDLKDRSLLMDGQTFPLTLHFAKAGDVTVHVKVQRQPPEASATHVN